MNKRGYTGIFKSGAKNMIMRFSDAGQHLGGVSKSVTPSIGFKFLRSNVISGTQLG